MLEMYNGASWRQSPWKRDQFKKTDFDILTAHCLHRSINPYNLTRHVSQSQLTQKPPGHKNKWFLKDILGTSPGGYIKSQDFI